MSEKAIFDAIGTLLAEQKAESESSIADIRKTLDSIKAIEPVRGDDGVGIEDVVSVDDGFKITLTNGVTKSFNVSVSDGIGIKAVEQADNAKSFDLVFDNDERASINLPEPLTGAKGEKGDSGIDRPIAEVRKACDGLPANEICTFDGGLYQTTKQTIGTPEDDAGAYRLVLNGIEKAHAEIDWQAREYKIGVRLTNGEQVKSTLPMAPCYVDDSVSTFIKGDYRIDDSVLKVYDGDSWSEYDLRGARGRTGRTGVGIKSVKAASGDILVEMSDGKAYSLPIVESVLETLVTEYKEVLIDLTVQTPKDIDAEIRRYSGIWVSGQRYNKGDIVTTYQGLYLALKDTSAAIEDRDDWAFMLGIQASGAGGGGGGAGGMARTSTIIADGSLQMGNFLISGLKDPRTGAVGKSDAVSRDAMEKAIAAGSLYQGVYKPSTNSPNLSALADVTIPPTSNVIGKPNPAAPGFDNPTDQASGIITWHNWKGNGFDSFAATLTTPLVFEVRLSNSKIYSKTLDAQSYADEAALEAALKSKFNAATEIKNFHVYVNGADCWIGVETGIPVYCTAIGGETGNVFPMYAPGTKNSILNSYNWVVVTVDENQPEALPEGIPGLPAGAVVKNSDRLQWSSSKNGFEILSGSSLTQNYSDTRYWQINKDNFKWVDQAYNQGAVVLHRNAWWQATQNIPAGSAEPGSTAAAAIWRRVNDSYGSRTFYGRGDFDPTDTTAANNFGMPTGTYPPGTQPLDGDAYYDVTSGTVTDFNVVNQPPKFTIDGNFEVGSTLQTSGYQGELSLAPLPGRVNLMTFNVDAANPPLPTQANYHILLPNDVTPTAGYFAGMTIPAGDIYLVFVGDPDAQDGGWVIINDTGTGNPYPFTLPTPHPQNVPDVITGTTSWGFRRNFEITFDAAVVDKSYRRVLTGFEMEPASYVIEIQDEEVDGSYYKFELTTARSVAALIAPITFIVHADHILKIGTSYVGGKIALDVQLNATAANKKFKIVVSTEVGDLGTVAVSDGTVDVTDAASNFESRSMAKADTNYPSGDLSNLMKALSGDANASIPIKGRKVGENVANQAFNLSTGKVTRYRGYALNKDDPYTVLLGAEKAAGSPIAASFKHYDFYGKQDYVTGSIGDWPVNTMWFNDALLKITPTNALNNTVVWVEVMVDKSDPEITFVEMVSTYYQASDSHRVRYEVRMHFDKDHSPGHFYFSSYADGGKTMWRVYKEI